MTDEFVLRLCALCIPREYGIYWARRLQSVRFHHAHASRLTTNEYSMVVGEFSSPTEKEELATLALRQWARFVPELDDLPDEFLLQEIAIRGASPSSEKKENT